MADFFSYHFSLISYHLFRIDLNRLAGCCLSIWLAALMLLTSCSSDDRQTSEISNHGSETANNPRLPGRAEGININTAGFNKLQRVPHVGASMAQKIIEHREAHGPFKRPEDLILIQGISDARYRRIRHLIKVE